MTGRNEGIDGIAATNALTRPPGSAELGDAYSDMISAFRTFVDALAGAAPNELTSQRLERDLRSWTTALEGLAVPDAQSQWGRWLDRAGRSQGLVPPIRDEVVTPTSATGTVVFGRFYGGKNAVVHGGAVALLFDELFGRMGFSDETAGRTAYLKTSYRSVAPVDAELSVAGRLEWLEGRKHHFRGEIRHGDVVCADAECLWVELRKGQP
ncbi:PaaI family thioesterase [Qaidamihabitans albus]|uniref:PaaI family thioesterase n=1 Tax=Qaidamihabitans albus TaxID=2795733 RepID=UPI0018F14659|nr:hotdog domain-containing protein [Qaidamihabitans albus]